ncbi:MAG: glycogen/starch synthase [Chlamydiota bacterium]
MHIVHVASEMAPIAKVGGLADAVTGLAKAQQKRNHVSVILPKYSLLSLDAKEIRLDMQFPCEKKRISYDVRVFHTEIEKIPVYLIETSPLLDHFYEQKIYLGTKRDSERFIYFCKTVAEYLIRKNQEIDVLHLHDWHSALMAPLVKEVYLSLKVLVKSVALSIHNLAYTGKFSLSDLEEIHYPLTHTECFSSKGFFFTYYSLMRGGLGLCDALVTVSPGYAKEILTKKYACGFVDLLEKRRDSISGILNGIDEELWDPEKDLLIPHRFPKNASLDEILLAKRNNKRALQKRLGLQEEGRPLIVCISRLADQKNPELMKNGLIFATKQFAQGILLGTSPLKKKQAHFEKLAKTYEHHPHLRFIPLFSNELSRWLYAAADFLFMPSKFEPCGLTQMIAMKYACVPIVHHIGGLKDTIFDPRYEKDSKKVNGFYFTKSSFSIAKETINYALDVWKKDRCKTLIENGMSASYSWDAPAKKYEAIYKQIVAKNRPLEK